MQIEPIKEGIVIREDYYKFVGSNVYLVNYNLRELWSAELPSDSDVYLIRINAVCPPNGGRRRRQAPAHRRRGHRWMVRALRPESR